MANFLFPKKYHPFTIISDGSFTAFARVAFLKFSVNQKHPSPVDSAAKAPACLNDFAVPGIQIEILALLSAARTAHRDKNVLALGQNRNMRLSEKNGRSDYGGIHSACLGRSVSQTRLNINNPDHHPDRIPTHNKLEKDKVFYSSWQTRG